jgi:ornithine carbamoyltransferase
MKRDLVTLDGLSAEELRNLLTLAAQLKQQLTQGQAHPLLAGRTLALVFEKPSLRTRVTFETGMFQLGGHTVYLAPDDIGLGKRESVADVARALSQWVDVIAARTFAQHTVEELAAEASVPVINALSDLAHPCQVIADLLTIQESRGSLDGVRVTFLGDGNNVVNSWLVAASKLGFDFTLACPAGYEPDAGVLERACAAAAGSITITHDLDQAADGADVLYTDVWTSMGQEEETATRLQAFAPYQLNQSVVDKATDGVIVMHDLPAHRGEEITDEVIDGPASVVMRQAENRMHAQKALLVWLLEATEAGS